MSDDQELDKMLDECFKAIDVDENGYLDCDEILNVLTHINSHPMIEIKKTPQQLAQDAKNIMEGLDVNKDKKISRAEFEDFFKERILNA